MSDIPQSDQVAHVQGLFLKHLPAMRGFVTSLVSDVTLVDDIIQESFITITDKADKYKRDTNFRAWAWTIARYKTLQLLDKRMTVKSRFAEDVIEALSAHEAAEDWEMETMLKHLGGCVEKLAPKARKAIQLRYMQAHQPPEIARSMGWSTNSVNVALSRARILLRDCVAKRVTTEPL